MAIEPGFNSFLEVQGGVSPQCMSPASHFRLKPLEVSFQVRKGLNVECFYVVNIPCNITCANLEEN